MVSRIEKIANQHILRSLHPIVPTWYNGSNFRSAQFSANFQPSFYSLSGDFSHTAQAGFWNETGRIRTFIPPKLRFKDSFDIGLLSPDIQGKHNFNCLSELFKELHKSFKYSGYKFSQPVIGDLGILENSIEFTEALSEAGYEILNNYNLIIKLFPENSNQLHEKQIDALRENYHTSDNFNILLSRCTSTRRYEIRKGIKFARKVNLILTKDENTIKNFYEKNLYVLNSTRLRLGRPVVNITFHMDHVNNLLRDGNEFVLVSTENIEEVTSICIFLLKGKSGVLHQSASTNTGLRESSNSLAVLVGIYFLQKNGQRYLELGRVQEDEDAKNSNINSFKRTFGAEKILIPTGVVHRLR